MILFWVFGLKTSRYDLCFSYLSKRLLLLKNHQTGGRP